MGSPRQAGYVHLHQAVPLVERQHTVIEELRLNWPRSTTAADLAARTGVSTRTIEGDIERLCDAGVPIERRRGRHGGFRLAATATPEPVALTVGEIATLIGSLSALGPYTSATGHTALRKLTDRLAVSPMGPECTMGSVDADVPR